MTGRGTGRGGAILAATGLGLFMVFLDATIVRCVLVPSTMQLLGNLNWWSPTWLKRIWSPNFRDL